ncbi:Tat pathway signal sequence domain protein [Echinicola jeungdonensis]|uniref:Tat pathway signal sequence domain protein n=1 Tax=Echinicola jeungdonensis TaxID=709343 RepID=A0ABV5J4Z9_9BACT|nr:Tat pathway signal sequence domain protein [Echinicola jeungdonensis]MDN3669530.1 Tat pathway signal sequence domain protein [Echinicola jeungdonensis]
MSNYNITRRNFVKSSALLSSSLFLGPTLANAVGGVFPKSPLRPVALHWLEETENRIIDGATWGVPWPMGQLKQNADFSLKNTNGAKHAVQSWPLAYWPDGSLKWTGHAMPSGVTGFNDFSLVPGEKIQPDQSLKVAETSLEISIDTGKIQCTINKKGKDLIAAVQRNGRTQLKNGRLVLHHQDQAPGEEGTVNTSEFEGKIEKISLEQKGPLRTVVKIEGKHDAEGKKAWLPFVVRLYFYQGGESIRVMHTIIYDGDEYKDFIKGLGLRFSVPMEDELYDRHIRFAGEEEGVFGEAVKGLTGLRRNPGQHIKTAQVEGKKTPPVDQFAESVSSRLHYIPNFGDYTLSQTSPDAFEIRKRTKKGHSWLKSGFGQRSRGTGYLGGPKGGVVFGIRNFWQSYPAQIDIRNAHTDEGEVTLWLWAPDAPAMDLRFYHDGMGQDTHEKQLDALNITYEDYEPGFGTPMGVARTSEMKLWILEETPQNETFNALANGIQEPAVVCCEPAYLHQVGVFGKIWDLPDRSSLIKSKIEDNLEAYFEFYHQQVDDRRWYGFWDYGDVMHSYDFDRHTWRYDVGGFAWDNSELSTDLWLWYYFLRTGRADVFRMAEAMTRHTGEVDVHHLGRFAPLGSRHNVQHWGCSAKQLRISTAANRRFYYYLTADERVGDLMREQVNAVETLKEIPPTRKVTDQSVWDTESDPNKVYVSFGTDYGAVSAAWFTEWERTGDDKVKEKLMNSMRTIAAQPKGFFSAGAKMDLRTGEFDRVDHQRASASHLSAVFGLMEVCAELVQNIDMPEFEAAWIQYCELYNAGEEEQEEVLGNALGKMNLGQGHSRLTAYAAKIKNDPELAQRAWREFVGGGAGYRLREPYVRTLEGDEVLRPMEEAHVSTNATAQWGLAAIQCLGLIGDELKW